MRLISWFLILLIGINSLASSKKDCAVRLEEASLHKAKIEIAELFLEKAKLGEKNTVLKSLLEKNIRQKFREFKAHFGVEINAIEIKELISKIERNIGKNEREEVQKEGQVRKNETKTIALTRQYFAKNMSKLHSLEEAYFNSTSSVGGNNDIIGSGVAWTADEKYVVFRNFELETWIYNTEKKEFLDYHPSTGVISDRGHLYAENSKNQTTVRDLDTGEKWGPFKGNPMHNFFDESFVIIHEDHPAPFPNNKERFHTLIDFRNNRQIILGEEFVMSLDRKMVARKVRKTIEVVEVATGSVIEKFIADDKSTYLSWSPGGFFTFQKKSKVNFVRLSDLKIFELPTNDEPDAMSSDGVSLVYKNFKSRNDEEAIVIFNLNTGKLSKFKGLGQFTLSPDGMHILIHRFKTKKTILLDLATMNTQDLPGDYGNWSANGRFVYNRDSDGQWYDHTVFDLATGKKFVVRAGFDFNFVGNTNYLLTEEPHLPPGSDRKTTYINDLGHWDGNPFSLRMGFEEAKPSPTGKFIVTYDKDDKVTLSEFTGQ